MALRRATIHACRPSRQKLNAEQKVGIAVCALLKRKDDPSKNVFDHMDAMGFGGVAKEFSDFRAKAQNARTRRRRNPRADDMSNEIIEILRPTHLLQIPGMMRIPCRTQLQAAGGATGRALPISRRPTPLGDGQTFRDVELSAKTLTAIIPVTNDLLNFSISGAMPSCRTICGAPCRRRWMPRSGAATACRAIRAAC